MGWVVVRIITNTKKPTSALAGKTRMRRYLVFFNGWFKLSNTHVYVGHHKY